MVEKYSIYVPVYGCRVDLYISEDIAEARKVVEKKYDISIIPEVMSAGAFDVVANGGVNYVVIMEAKREAFPLGTLVHELLHITYIILRSIGNDDPHEETKCYLLQYIFEKFDARLYKAGWY